MKNPNLLGFSIVYIMYVCPVTLDTQVAQTYEAICQQKLTNPVVFNLRVSFGPFHSVVTHVVQQNSDLGSLHFSLHEKTVRWLIVLLSLSCVCCVTAHLTLSTRDKKTVPQCAERLKATWYRFSSCCYTFSMCVVL